MVKSKFSIAIHIMTLLAYHDNEYLPSSLIASSLNINPVLVRKEVKALKASGLVLSKEGKKGGVMLSKPADKILLLDIYESISKGDFIFELSSNVPNASCEIGAKINDQLLNLYDRVDLQIKNSLQKETLATFKNRF